MTSVRIAAEGRPAPKGSRIQGVTKAGRQFTRPASKHEAPWVRAVKLATEVQMRHHPQIPPPYAVQVDLLIARPHRLTRQWPSQHDVDKLVRSTIDGLVQGGALDDDRHIVELHASKRFTIDGESPGAIAIVTTAVLDAR